MDDTAMDDTALLDQLAADGDRLAVAAERAGWDARVPTLDWDVRALVSHTGAVHRWAADIVREARATNETGGSAAFRADVADDALLDWFRSGHRALLDTLRRAPDDLAAYTIIRRRPARSYWIRRQAHETAIHRVDAEGAAAEAVTAFATDFAQDGIAELVQDFARARSFAVERAATLALHADDGPSWLISFGGERTHGEPTGPTEHIGTATAKVAGTSSDLYRWLWNRPASVRSSGDDTVPGLWRAVRV